jgi:branched-chain amino acid transport system substrate-binding protein
MVKTVVRTTKVTMLVVAALLGVLLTSGCGGAKSTPSTTAEPYKVGAILSLTGPYAALGASEKQALELEVKRINDAGGINGRNVEVIIEDDGTDEAKAVAAASKLIEQDRVVAILGATGTGQSMAIRSEVDRAGIPQLSMAGGTAITAKLDPQVFQTPWSNTIVVPFVLDKIAADGHKKVGILTDSGGYGKDGRAVIVESAPKAGVTVVADQTFNPGDTDFSAQLVNIKNSGADAVLIWTAGKEGAAIVKAAADLGISAPRYGGSGQAKLEFAEGAGPAAEGFVFGTGKSLTPSNWGTGTPEFAVVDGFSKRYSEAYGQPPDIFAGHAFDALAILQDALERTGGDTDPAKLTKAVEATKGLTGFGGVFTFSPSNHNGLSAEDLALYRITEGAWTTAP